MEKDNALQRLTKIEEREEREIAFENKKESWKVVFFK